MFLRVRKNSSVPVSRQIADQVRALCSSGTLRPGDRVPSVRELAESLAVNPNTVLRVYERLTAEGLLERRHGSGTFVSENGPLAAQREHHGQLVRELRGVLRQAVMLGLDDAAIAEICRQAVAAERRDMAGGQGAGSGDQGSGSGTSSGDSAS
jgi:GntR family transcriptional regulator